MKKIDKSIADAYYSTRKRLILYYLAVWAIVSFGVVAFADQLTSFNVNGMPFHYFMGAQGAILVFIALLFINAVASDKIDQKYGINEEDNVKISAGKTIDH